VGKATRDNASGYRLSLAKGATASIFLLRIRYRGNRNHQCAILNSSGGRLAAEISIGYTARFKGENQEIRQLNK
jgi:hypothetical protein